MSMDEAVRHELLEQLRSALGEGAATLKAHLPPFDWTELVAKGYLDDRLEELEHRITAAFRVEVNEAIAAQMRTTIYAALGSSLTTGLLVLAAIQLA